MSVALIETIGVVIYSIGIIGWSALWWITDGFRLSLKIKFLWMPFVLPVIVFTIAIVSLVSNGQVAPTFLLEEQLLTLIEDHTQKLIMAVFGMIILSSVLVNLGKKKVFSSEIMLFLALTLVFSVGGVLVLYWLPTDSPEAYFLLRHAKTIPYTYSIGLFLTALIILLHNYAESIKP